MVLMTLNMPENSGFSAILIHSPTTTCDQIVFTIIMLNTLWYTSRNQDASLPSTTPTSL